MKRLPTAYWLVLTVLGVVAVLVALISFGVPPFDNLYVFLASQIIAFFILLILGVVGGAFAGMLLAQRILGDREFSPFERAVLQGLSDLRERLETLEKRAEDEARIKR